MWELSCLCRMSCTRPCQWERRRRLNFECVKVTQRKNVFRAGALNLSRTNHPMLLLNAVSNARIAPFRVSPMPSHGTGDPLAYNAPIQNHYLSHRVDTKIIYWIRTWFYIRCLMVSLQSIQLVFILNDTCVCVLIRHKSICVHVPMIIFLSISFSAFCKRNKTTAHFAIRAK